jgi:NarL family two-component system response regulator YdfI
VPPAELADFVQDAEPAPALLLLTDSSADLQAYTSLPLRAWGALPLDASEGELAAAVLALHEGLVVGALALMQPLSEQVMLTGGDIDLLVEELTARETEVLQLLAYGLANKQIAYELEISEHTVKFHVSSIYTKLGATNRTEAVRLAVRLGLIVL